LKKLSVALCVIWIVVIFFMSSEDGLSSNKKSYFFVDNIKRIYQSITNQQQVSNSNLNTKKNSSSKTKVDTKLNAFVRKTAHFTEYLILGILVANAFFKYNHKGRGAIVYILFICLLTAVLDEYNQSFISRTSKVSDILIDFVGAVIGMIIYYFNYYKVDFRRLRHRKPA
jgi:VanZ family protein